MIQKKEEGATTVELINIYKNFNLDKTKASKWMKNKDSIIQAASEQQKKKNCLRFDQGQSTIHCFEIFWGSSKIQDWKVAMLTSTGCGIKGIKYTENRKGMRTLF